jgi:NADPH-dependent curcumin reductase
MNKNTQILLAARPQGMVKDSDFLLHTAEIPPVTEGGVLIQNEYISLDPAMRGWMNEGTTYIKGVEIGAVMRSFSAGRVVASKHPDFSVGDNVVGLTGVQAYAVSNGAGLTKVDLSKGQLSRHLGILGMPGMTAYFGLLARGKPRKGETIFVSGAAGIIGAAVGQMGKIKGCKVIGCAGGKDKCDYLLQIGFDGVIDYKTEDVAQRLKELAPEGIHIYFDNVGGDILDAALTNLARGARVVICGAISQYNNAVISGPKNYMKIVSARGTLTGLIVFDFIDQYAKAVLDISKWLKSGKLQYKEHIIEGIENFPLALRMLFEGKNFGKLVLKIGE